MKFRPSVAWLTRVTLIVRLSWLGKNFTNFMAVWTLDSSVSTVTKLQAGFHLQQRSGFFLFATMSRPAYGPTQSSVQWIPAGEADRLLPLSAKIKNMELYLHSCIHLRGVVLIMQRDNSTHFMLCIPAFFLCVCHHCYNKFWPSFIWKVLSPAMIDFLDISIILVLFKMMFQRLDSCFHPHVKPDSVGPNQ
jgi:hypothetical protein